MYGLSMAPVPSGANPLPASDLAAFAAAVEAASVRGAADSLQLTQSAVTKRIQHLERRVGGQLLDRGRFGTRPTDLGQTIYPPAKRALEALADIERTIELLHADAATDLRLSASLTIGEFLLPGWVGEFRTRRPEIRVQLEIINSRGVLDTVREGRAEIGFVEGLDPLKGLDSITIARDQLVVVVAAEHPWARRRAIAPRDLLMQPYLTRETASGTRAVAETALARAGIELTPSMQAASFQSLKRALAGGGFALISELTIEVEQRAGNLVAIPVRGLDLQRELHAVRPRRATFSAPALAFWRWLRDRAEALLAA
jgi:DNA-binding transcriptional LysR family regulator